jgi:ribonuclease BN (tRNA processing enzyme)
MDAAHVAFLGTGDAFSADGRYHASYLVRAPGSTVLLDCGGHTLTALKHHRIDASAVDLVVLSHFHGDHFNGLPYLLLEYVFEQPRRRPLRVAGPPGVEERVWSLLRATYKELFATPLPFALEFTEMRPDVPAHFGAVDVEPFLVPHQEKEISFGMRVGLAGRVILYSGDSGWTEALVDRSRNTNLFICECSYFETRKPFHLDYPRLAENRARFQTDRMILTHLGREVFARRNEVEIEMASDGMVVEL